MKVLCIQAPRIPAGDAETYLKGVLKKYAEDEFQMIVLPEKWITNSLEEKDPVFQALIDAFREASDKYSCDVIPGSFSLERNGKLYNSSPFIHGGKVIGYQDKISLFKGEIGKYSSGDRIRLFNSGSLNRDIPGSRLEILETAGHTPHATNADEVGSLISSFLDQQRF